MLFTKVVAGDYSGDAVLKIGALWAGPKPEKFKGISFFDPKTHYASSQIVRVVHLAEDSTKSFLGSALTGAAGGVVLGSAGLIAGVLVGGKKKKIKLGIEFDDGKKVVIVQDSKDKAFMCFLMYSKETGILEQDLGF